MHRRQNPSDSTTADVIIFALIITTNTIIIKTVLLIGLS
jgi:hypothetical protein